MYWPFATGVMQRRLAYKIAFFMRIFGGLVQVFILASLWDAIFRSSPEPLLQGYDRAGILSYVVMSWFVGQLVNVGVEWTVAMEIRQGQIAVNLVRPVNYFARLLAESGGHVLLNLVSVVVPGWLLLQAILGFGMGLPLPDLGRVGLFLLSLGFAFTLSFLVNFLFALSAFWLTYVFGFIMLKIALVRLFTGELIPLAFFPAGIGRVFEYLPFAGMVATPVGIYLGTYSGLDVLRVLAIQAVWVLVLLGATRLAWKGALRRLTVSGG
jgi:ABC-2 type transport system permease protein